MLPGFYRSIKQAGIRISDISYVLATHYHPDHMGLIPELMKLGVKLLLIDTQIETVHFSDYIFARDRLPFEPIDETKAKVISCTESRVFLAGIGINGEIISTPSHSSDSVSLVLDSGECFIGDLPPREHIDAYEKNDALKADWRKLMGFHPKRVFRAHVN